MQIKPDIQRFQELSKKANLIAVTGELSVDMDTPVSVYSKLVGDRRGFILESVDTTQQKFGRYSFIGANPFALIQVYPKRLMIRENDRMKLIEGSPIESIKAYMARYRSALEDAALPLANGGMVGYFNYEIVSAFDRVRGMTLDEEELLGEFMICRILIVFDALKNTARLIYLAQVDEKDPEAVYEEARQAMYTVREKLTAPLGISDPPPVRTEKIDFMKRYGKVPQDFLDAIEKAKEHIFSGDIFQVVPSKQFREHITKPCFHFYRRLRQVNPSPYMFYLNFRRTKLVGASPEMLVKVVGDRIFTYPIAGTRRRGKDDEEDERLCEDLLRDEKECAEHAMLVDLARNDIGRISQPGTVKVTKFKVIEKFSHVLHIVSEVVGTLQQGTTAMDVLQACFPAGTVSGAPKLRAMEIIRTLEPVRRETYAGTVGYMDFAGNMDMCITLRTMRVEDDETAVIQSGAGIVAESVANREYEEILQKAKALFEIVEEVENDVVTFR